jgi:hypothetical protein
MSRFQVPIRLLAAFLCGWLFAFLDVIGYVIDYIHHSWNISPGALTLLLALLLPLGLGAAAALTVNRGNKHLISLAVGTGLLALTGWYGYWLPGVMRRDAELAASCHSTHPDPACSHGPINPESYFGTSFLVFSWLIGVLLVLVSSLITSLIISYIMKHWRSVYVKKRSREQHDLVCSLILDAQAFNVAQDPD